LRNNHLSFRHQTSCHITDQYTNHQPNAQSRDTNPTYLSPLADPIRHHLYLLQVCTCTSPPRPMPYYHAPQQTLSPKPQIPSIPNKQMRKPKFPLVILQKYLLKSISTFPVAPHMYPPAQTSGNLKQTSRALHLAGLLAYRSDLHTHTSCRFGIRLGFPS
jgi:hypothetical protein